MVLAYHAVSDAGSFAAQLDFIARNMRPVSLAEAADATGRRRPLPPHAVLITFDDGDRTVLEVAAPLMKERRLPGVACVIAGVLDSEAPFWWDEAVALARAGGTVRGQSVGDLNRLLRSLKSCSDEERLDALDELRRSAGREAPASSQLASHDLPALEEMGIEVANHTMTHPILPRCAPTKIEEEIEAAHDRLTTVLGRAPRAFAYPNGDWDVTAERVLRRLGYEAAFLFDHRLVDPATAEPLRLSRVRADASASAERFRILASGLHPFLHHVRGRG